jgi:hypothetical protein
MDKKSTSGCFLTLGSTMVSWCSMKQTYVSLSTAEEEYIALSAYQTRTKFEYLCNRLGVAKNASLAKREC